MKTALFNLPFYSKKKLIFLYTHLSLHWKSAMKYDRNNIYFTPHWIHFRVFNSVAFYFTLLFLSPSIIWARLHVRLWAEIRFTQIHITYYVAPVCISDFTHPMRVPNPLYLNLGSKVLAYKSNTRTVVVIEFCFFLFQKKKRKDSSL